MKIVTEFPYEVEEHADFGITMSDGCRLSARVWMPTVAEQEPMPVILEHLPYRKRDGTIVRDEFTHPWFAGHGYVCIRTDIRGNGESEGLMKDEYSTQELSDAKEIIEWAASQPWCNGNVGMIGISWGGFNGLQLAYLQPEALKAVVTVCSTVDRYADDIHYKGGCLLGENFGWASNMLSYSSRPPDPKLIGENKWLQVWQHRLENLDFDLSAWLHHQHRDDYWKHGSVCEDYSRLTAAVLTVGGWHDGYRNTISHLVENLESPVKGIVGPWIHKYPHYAAPQPAIGFLQECKRWWDQYLKGIDTGVAEDPDYRAFVMNSIKPKRWLDERPGRWIAETHWPSDNIKPIELHFNNDQLSFKSGSTDVTVSSPQDCGACGGEYFPFAFSDELPSEQSYDNARSCCFYSEAINERLDIVGAPEITLTLASSTSCAQIAVRLLDQRPDGTSALITHGVFNLTHITSHEFPVALKAGEKIDVSFALDQIAYHLPAGHKMAIALSTSYWPLIWPSPAQTSLTLSSGNISIPVRTAADDISRDEVQFEAPEGASHWQPENLRPASYQHDTTTDPKTGVVLTSIVCDFGENKDTNHGLISGGKMQEQWSIHPNDPLSAKVNAQWQQTGGRADAMWRTEVTTAMHSDSGYFYISAELTATLNDKPFFKKSYKDRIERQLV